MKKTYFLLVISMLVLSCKKENPPLQFETLTVDREYTKNCNPESENCTYINFQIPQATGKGERSRKTNSEIKNFSVSLIDYKEDTLQKSLEKRAEEFLKDYEDYTKEFPEYSIPWQASVKGEVVNKTPNLVCIRFNLEIFTGGAHGYASTNYLNLDAKTGKPYSEKELFTPEFKNYAESLFRKKYSIPKKDSINSTGFFFENDQFQLPQNIGFHKDKIFLQYNAYEVASYADGGLKIEIPHSDAKKYLKIN